MSKKPPLFTYAPNGKEVLCNGYHFADARDSEAAFLIAEALNYNAIVEVAVPCDICKTIGGHVATCQNGRKPN